MNKFANEVLVSVVIPNYKRTRELKRSLDSVLSQTYTNLEILVVDDCSPNIKDIEVFIQQINDNRITLIKHNINKGGGGARNTGILKAKGKYIAFLDSDDTWEREKIEKQVSISEKYFEDILCYTKNTVHTDNWTHIKPKRGMLKDEQISEYLFINDGFIPTPSIFVSSSLARNCLFNESLPRHQDYDFLFKLEKQKVKILFIDESLTNIYWINVESLVKRGWSSEFSQKFFDSYKEYMGKKAYANACFHSVIYSSIQHESRRKSLNHLINNLSMVRYVNITLLIKYLLRLIHG